MKKKRKSLIEAEKSMELFLAKVGYTGKYKGKIVNDIPDYKVKSNLPKTSDVIPGKTPKKAENVYSGFFQSPRATVPSFFGGVGPPLIL